jgi:hypothetical protein
LARIAINRPVGVDLRDMPSRLLCTPRLAAALLATAALGLAAPAVGLASSQTRHAGPTAHIALGLMDSGVRHAPAHHAVRRHQRVAAFTTTSW